MNMAGGRDATTFRSAIQGYGLAEWNEEAKWTKSQLTSEDESYYDQVHADFALMITTSKGISLRHIKSTFETHCGRVNLDRLQMASWRTLVISFRHIIDFRENVLTGEVFLFASNLGKKDCPSHLQSLMIATPNQPGEPNLRELEQKTCKQVFFAGVLDSVNGALVDPRVPNQSAQIATKEDIEAKKRPQPPQPSFSGKGKYPRGKLKLTFEEQIAPKPAREMCTAVALGPTEVIQDPEVASVNLDKLLARVRAKEADDLHQDSSAEGSQGPVVDFVEDASTPPRRRGASSDSGSHGSSNGSNSRPFRMPKKKATLDYVPVAEVHAPSAFHLRFKPNVQAAAKPFASDEERLAARQAVNLRDTEYEKRVREKLAREEAERKIWEEQMEKKIKAEEEERRRGLEAVEEAARKNREEEAARKAEEQRRLQEAREAARKAEEERQLMEVREAARKAEEQRRLLEAREADEKAKEKIKRDEVKRLLVKVRETETLLNQLGKIMKKVRDEREADLLREEEAWKLQQEQAEREQQLLLKRQQEEALKRKEELDRQRETELLRQRQEKEALEAWTAWTREQEEAASTKQLHEEAVRQNLRRLEGLREARRNKEILRQEEEKALERQRTEIARKKAEEAAILKQIAECEEFQRMIEESL